MSELQQRFFEEVLGDCHKESIIDREPASIVHYTWPGYIIKQPTPNRLATQCHVNWPVFTPKEATKSWK